MDSTINFPSERLVDNDVLFDKFEHYLLQLVLSRRAEDRQLVVIVELVKDLGDQWRGVLQPSLFQRLLPVALDLFLQGQLVVRCLLLGEVVDLRPVVVEHRHLGLPELLVQFDVAESAEVRELDVVRALDDRLAVAVQAHLEVLAVAHSELLGGADEPDVRAVPDKHRGLAGGAVDEAVVALVHVQVGRDVEDVDLAVAAGVYVELLRVQSVQLLDFELRGKVDEAVVVQVHVLVVSIGLLGWHSDWCWGYLRFGLLLLGRLSGLHEFGLLWLSYNRPTYLMRILEWV